MDELLSLQEAAVRLGVKRNALWKWRVEGRLKFVTVGNHTLIRARDLSKVRRPTLGRPRKDKKR